MGLVQEAPSFSHGQKVWKSTSVWFSMTEVVRKCKWLNARIEKASISHNIYIYIIYVYIYYIFFWSFFSHMPWFGGWWCTKKDVAFLGDADNVRKYYPNTCWRKLKRWNASGFRLVTSLKLPGRIQRPRNLLGIWNAWGGQWPPLGWY